MLQGSPMGLIETLRGRAQASSDAAVTAALAQLDQAKTNVADAGRLLRQAQDAVDAAAREGLWDQPRVRRSQLQLRPAQDSTAKAQGLYLDAVMRLGALLSVAQVSPPEDPGTSPRSA